MDRFTALVDIRFQIKLFNLNSVAAGRRGCRPGDVKLLQFNVWYLDRGRSISAVTAGDTVLVFTWFSVIYPALITLITTLLSVELSTIFRESFHDIWRRPLQDTGLLLVWSTLQLDLNSRYLSVKALVRGSFQQGPTRAFSKYCEYFA